MVRYVYLVRAWRQGYEDTLEVYETLPAARKHFNALCKKRGLDEHDDVGEEKDVLDRALDGMFGVSRAELLRRQLRGGILR
jgi:hypothetical protein